MAGRSSGEHTALHREFANLIETTRGSGLSRLTARAHVNNCVTVKQLFLLIAQERRQRDGLCLGITQGPMASQARLAAHSALPEFTFARAETT